MPQRNGKETMRMDRNKGKWVGLREGGQISEGLADSCKEFNLCLQCVERHCRILHRRGP